MVACVAVTLFALCASNPVGAHDCDKLDHDGEEEEVVEECYRKVIARTDIECEERMVALLWLAQSSSYQQKRELLYGAVKTCPTALTPRLQVWHVMEPSQNTIRVCSPSWLSC